jgi:hypothetical protein
MVIFAPALNNIIDATDMTITVQLKWGSSKAALQRAE